MSKILTLLVVVSLTGCASFKEDSYPNDNFVLCNQYTKEAFMVVPSNYPHLHQVKRMPSADHVCQKN